jgi:hypothetical protein
MTGARQVPGASYSILEFQKGDFLTVLDNRHGELHQ